MSSIDKSGAKMGLLTNPNSDESSKILVFLQKHGQRLGVVCYFAGLIWLGFLANVEYNMKTYFSENALLPGLVVENFGGGHRAENYLNELIEQDEKPEHISPEYLQGLFLKIGLSEVELQNYTFIDPVTKSEKDALRGTNVFAVLRAKRAAGTEALVFNAPFFPRHTPARKNLASIALMLALAEYFQSQVYWAKDIVFLVAEGHIGTLAWVKGHQEMMDNKDNLRFERVRTKAGNIQAAINVIMEGNAVCGLETKFHGINGQLPNLDFVNLLNKFIVSDAEKRSDWERDVWKLINYMQIQATGTPTGSHGFFLKYGIESVTMTGKSSKVCKARNGFSFGDMGRILEAVFRSLNNLLERLHQSFFFYLKTTPNRFISISLYFPPIALIIFPIVLKGASTWLTKKELSATQGLFRLMAIHSLAVFFRWSLSNLNQILDKLPLPLPPNFQITSEMFLQTVLGLVAAQFIFSKILLRNSDQNLIDSMYCFCLLEFATSLYSLALFNPSLVILVGMVGSPLLTLLFFFEPKQRMWLFGLISAVLVGGVARFYDVMEVPVNKYFFEADVYGNFLFDYAFLVVIPVVASITAVL